MDRIFKDGLQHKARHTDMLQIRRKVCFQGDFRALHLSHKGNEGCGLLFFLNQFGREMTFHIVVKYFAKLGD